MFLKLNHKIRSQKNLVSSAHTFYLNKIYCLLLLKSWKNNLGRFPCRWQCSAQYVDAYFSDPVWTSSVKLGTVMLVDHLQGGLEHFHASWPFSRWPWTFSCWLTHFKVTLTMTITTRQLTLIKRKENQRKKLYFMIVNIAFVFLSCYFKSNFNSSSYMACFGKI